LARMATQAAVMVMRLSLSARDSDGVVMVVMVGCCSWPGCRVLSGWPVCAGHLHGECRCPSCVGRKEWDPKVVFLEARKTDLHMTKCQDSRRCSRGPQLPRFSDGTARLAADSGAETLEASKRLAKQQPETTLA
jgi:hypothetical protein